MDYSSAPSLRFSRVHAKGLGLPLRQMTELVQDEEPGMCRAKAGG
jgi:hypothetical protein